MFQPGEVIRNPGSMGHMWRIVGIDLENMRLMAKWSNRKDIQPVTCLLNPANQPDITHDSYFVYGMMREFSEDTIRTLITEGNLIPAGQVDSVTLQRIQEGVFIDKKVPPFIRKRYAHLKKWAMGRTRSVTPLSGVFASVRAERSCNRR